jgi:histidyl-tRNA synthetase
MSTKPPGGTRDFLPAEIKRREYVMGVVREVYERYGFEPLETPAFENIETLLGKYGDEGNKLVFKILRRGELESRGKKNESGDADLALRYDLTVPLARVVAQYQNELPRFFRRYQMQPVWRADRPAKGRFREFYQCDIDAIGSTSPIVEVDLIGAVTTVMKTLGFEDFVVRLNHRKLLSALIETAGIPPSLTSDALVAIDKLDKVGSAGVVRELLVRGVDALAAERCLDLFGSSPEQRISTSDRIWNVVVAPGADVNEAILSHLQESLADHQSGLLALADLRTILDLVNKTPAGARVAIDPRLARGLSYYTGAIMEITVPDLAGSLGGGGRYDNLIGMFLGRDIPACGFSLGLERIIFVMTERDMFPAAVARGAVDVMVTIWNQETCVDSLALASALRSAGLRVDVYPDADKLGKQVKYASSRQVPFVAILGDDERARGEVSVKDLRTGEQQGVAPSEAAAFIRSRLTSPRAPALIPR